MDFPRVLDIGFKVEITAFLSYWGYDFCFLRSEIFEDPIGGALNRRIVYRSYRLPRIPLGRDTAVIYVDFSGERIRCFRTANK